MEACRKAGIKYIELPVAFDALTVVDQPEEHLGQVSMTVAELKKMWEPAAQGKITKWNQVNPKWPDEKLMLFGPGADSGTFDYFTEAINGKAKASRGDFTASEDDNVLVQGVAQQQERARLLRLRLLRGEQGQAEGGRDRQGKGKGPVAAVPRERDQRHLQAAGAPDLHLRPRHGRPSAEVREFVEFIMKNGRSWSRKWATCRCRRAPTTSPGSTSRPASSAPCSAATPQVGITIEELLALKLNSNRAYPAGAGPGSQGPGPFASETEAPYRRRIGEGLMSATATTRHGGDGEGGVLVAALTARTATGSSS